MPGAVVHNPLYPLWRRFRRTPTIRRLFYDMVGRVTMRRTEWQLMNFGFADAVDAGLPESVGPDSPERYALALYHRVVANTPLLGKRVLEIGCGRGGGARYVVRTFEPAHMLAVDFAPTLVRFCQAKNDDSRLEYQVGNAMKLALEDSSFDAVINVESSHCYPDKLAFINEVRRVLRPNGTFHYADDFARRSWNQRRKQLEDAKFKILEEEDITRGVLASMDADAQRRRQMVNDLAPPLVREVVSHWAGLPGSDPYNRFANGTNRYMRALARRMD